MAYDLFDPNQEAEFRKKALERGIDPMEVDQFINYKKREIKTVPTNNMDVVKAIESGNLKLSDLPQDERKQIGVSMSQLGIRLPNEKDADEYRKVSSVINTLLTAYSKIPEIQKGPIQGAIAKRMPFGLAPDATEYEEGRAGMAGALKYVVGESGRLTDQDVIRIMKILPTVTDTPRQVELAIQRLDNLVRSVYGKGLSENQKLDVKQSVNIDGETAKKDDLVFNRSTARLDKYGQTENPEPVIKRSTDKKIETDSNLINFLANSDFLPIAGSIIGGIAGVPLGIAGSIGAGAAGAASGEALKRGLIELLDPNIADFGYHAKAILSEAMTDAVFSGLTFAIAPVAKGAFKLVLKKPGQEAIETIAKEARLLNKPGEEILTGAGKTERKGLSKILKEQARRTLKKTLKGESALANFKRTWGVDPIDVILESGTIPKNADELTKLAKSLGQTASSDLTKLLSKNKASVSEVVEALEEAKAGFIANKKIMPWAKTGVNKIDEVIDFVKSFGDEIPGADLNKVKQGLQEIFPKSGEVTKASAKVVARGSTKTRLILEDLPPKLRDKVRVKGANFEKAYTYLMRDLGEKASTKEVAGPLFDFTDGILLLNPKLLLLKKVVDVLKNKLSPWQRASVFMRASNLLAKQGPSKSSKATMRTLFRLGFKLNLKFGVEENLLKGGLRSAKSVQQMLRDLRGEELDTSTPIDPNMMNLQPTQPSGGGGIEVDSIPGKFDPIRTEMGVNLGAYSREGVPLYR